jgi:hypothetical protein
MSFSRSETRQSTNFSRTSLVALNFLTEVVTMIMRGR